MTKQTIKCAHVTIQFAIMHLFPKINVIKNIGKQQTGHSCGLCLNGRGVCIYVSYLICMYVCNKQGNQIMCTNTYVKKVFTTFWHITC